MPGYMKVSQLLLAAGLLLAGCTAKEGDPGPAGAAGDPGATGPSGQTLTGNIAGFVTGTDEFGAALTGAQKAGFTVTVEGSSPAITATTNADGRFELSKVLNGPINLLIQKPGYSSQRRLGIVHAGGNVPTYVGFTSVAQVSSSTVPSISVGSPTTLGIPFSFLLYNPLISQSLSQYTAIRVFFDTQPNVTATAYTKTVVFDYLYSGFNQESIVPADLGYPSGTRVYMVAYGSVPFTNVGYTDLATGRDVWTALNPTPSAVVSFVMP
jgi:hypothetical protein